MLGGITASVAPGPSPSPVGHLNGMVGWQPAGCYAVPASLLVTGERGYKLSREGEWAEMPPPTPSSQASPPLLCPWAPHLQASPSASQKTTFPLKESACRSEGERHFQRSKTSQGRKPELRDGQGCAPHSLGGFLETLQAAALHTHAHACAHTRTSTSPSLLSS